MPWTVPTIERIDEPFVGDERAMLDGFLEWQRASLWRVCEGLTGEQLVRASAPPSSLTLLGLIRHVTEVERTWFRRRFAGENLDPLYSRPDRPAAAFEEVAANRAEADFAALRSEWEGARRAVAGASLDATFLSERWGQMSLRWIYLHMIREYALHNGHAELLRERIDGATFG
jgi:hypothetical protein